MVQHFLLKCIPNWQKPTPPINYRIYGENLFAVGMMGAGWMLAALCLIGSHTQFWIMHTIWNYGPGMDLPREVHGKE
ncbi:hypothetical protein BH689_02515 [Escherichia coli]|nr:hypothetical protein BH689_02515 [Escherichia coli]